MITFPVNLSQVTIIPRLTINNYFQVCFAEQLVLTKKMSSPVINLLLCIQQKELTITLSVNTFDLLSLTFFICKIIIFYSGLGPPDSSVIKIIDYDHRQDHRVYAQDHVWSVDKTAVFLYQRAKTTSTSQSTEHINSLS